MVQSPAPWCSQFITTRLRSSWCWISLKPKEQRPAQSLFLQMNKELHKVYSTYSVFTIIAHRGWPRFNQYVFWSDPPVTKEPSATLYTQANDFLQRVKSNVTIIREVNAHGDSISHFYLQLQIFEDLLKCQQLSPDEQRKVTSQVTRKSRN